MGQFLQERETSREMKTYLAAKMGYRTTSNPDKLSAEEILDWIRFCPVCGTSWPKRKQLCDNPDCGVKVRVEPRAYNWWMFYPRHNSWAHLRE
ncbi:MAG: hypothetical protein JSW61_10480 [Candidatus Thorarchaeota archaeon]|nr:MAG: hypothetical protein JSW61_10480 [Candidatus Thorarchaeota archaeon]